MSGAALPAGPGREARLARELEHHRRIAPFAERIWNWESPAGRRRAERRAALFVEHGALAPGVQALELGCGVGVFLERVAASGASLRGLDLSPDLLERAGERLARFTNLALDLGNAERMPYPDRRFDVVYGSSVLHHLDLDAALREVHRVLRPGGRVVFAEPNLLNPQIAVIFRVRPLRARLGVSPDEMAFTRWRARRALVEAGFVGVDVAPFDFLHPATPAGWVERVGRMGRALERLALVREIGGSLLLRARRAEAD